MDREKATELVLVNETQAELPPILVGRAIAAVEAQVRSFYESVGLSTPGSFARHNRDGQQNSRAVRTSPRYNR